MVKIEQQNFNGKTHVAYFSGINLQQKMSDKNCAKQKNYEKLLLVGCECLSGWVGRLNGSSMIGAILAVMAILAVGSHNTTWNYGLQLQQQLHWKKLSVYFPLKINIGSYFIFKTFTNLWNIYRNQKFNFFLGKDQKFWNYFPTSLFQQEYQFFLAN